MNLTLNMEKTLDAVIDSSIRVNCGSCGEICPVGAINELERKVEGISEDQGNEEARAVCPLGIVPQVLAEYIKQGRVDDAAEYLYGRNPLAAVCAYTCDQSCTMGDKRRSLPAEPVDIAAMERFLTDKVRQEKINYSPRYREKIAVIGGGPAGIAAANKLALRGYRVTIIERDQTLGGAMAWGIPGFRLDKDLLDAEIEKIVFGGITVKCGINVGEDISLDELREDYDAVILASGASKGAVLNFEGTDGDMVLDGVSVLRAINLRPEDEFTAVGDKVVVIGGGGFAADVSRTLARKGKEVSCVAMEDEKGVQIDADVLKAMAAEGIEFKCKAAPKKIVRNNGQITEVEFGSVVLRENDEGKKIPAIADEVGFYIPCDTVVFAVGRKFLVDGIGQFSRYPDGAVKVDKLSRTSREKIFACGDVTGVSNSVIGAISSGKEAAEHVDAFLRGRHFPYRHADFAGQGDETIVREEIAMVRPQRETTIFSKTGRINIAPAEDIISLLRQAGIEEDMPLLVDREAPDFAKKKKVAVIGGGIAGITAAIELAKKGYAPVIFEKTPHLGGKYRWFATEKRIDSDGAGDELAKVEASGIQVITNASAGIKPSISELKAEGFGAILFAIGESRGVRPDMPGAYSVGIFEMISLASRLTRNLIINSIGGNAIVTGSDEMAVDVARKLKEYAGDVTLICRCSREELDRRTGAVSDALEEGVNLVTGTELVGLDTGDGNIKAAELRIISKDLVINVPCDTLVIGDTGMADTATVVARNPALKTDERGRLVTDEKLRTPISGVLSIGTCGMPSVEAGRAGALAVHSFLSGDDVDVDFIVPEQTEDNPKYEIIEGTTMADKGFEVGRHLLTGKQARQEASRYICAGYHQVNVSRCIGCGICTEACPEGAIELIRAGEVR